ncbi:MAG: type II secretion system protein N [Steroidobacteraceae bacterium]
MARYGALAVAALAGFLLVLVARLPLRWALPALPKDIHCIEPAGSLWSGSCASLEVQGLARGSIAWELRPLQLLLGRLAAEVRWSRAGGHAQGELQIGPGGRYAARDLNLDVQLGSGPVPGVPADLRGRLQAQLARIALRTGAIVDANGRIAVDELSRAGGGGPIPLGSYQLEFAEPPGADGRIVGRLHDTGRPLNVSGTLTLLRDPEPGYLLEGSVAARAGADPELARQITFLGAPDAAGRRSFAQEATF